MQIVSVEPVSIGPWTCFARFFVLLSYVNLNNLIKEKAYKQKRSNCIKYKYEPPAGITRKLVAQWCSTE